MANLSNREIEVLKLVAIGRNNKDIAESINSSLHTVKAHITSIMRKLNVDNRTKIAYWAYVYGLIDKNISNLY